MGFWIGLAGALVGAIAGGIVTWTTTRQQMRRELAFHYDRELRIRRFEAYKSLYMRTKILPRYWRTNPTRSEISEWSFDEWYFDESGGMFLTNAARELYHNALEAIASVHSATGPDRISDEEVERLWRAGQALRRQLSADLGSSDVPRMKGTRPYATPAPTTRIRNLPNSDQG